MIPVARLTDYPILAQTEGSGLQAIVIEWLLQHRIDANLMLSSNSLSALCGLRSPALASPCRFIGKNEGFRETICTPLPYPRFLGRIYPKTMP